MDLHLLAAPAGFNAAVNTLNGLAGAMGTIAELANETLLFLASHHGKLSAAEYRSKLAAAGVSVAEQDVQSVINAIVFIFRGALSAGADGAAVKAALDSSSDVSTPVADVLAKAVDESRRVEAAEAEEKGTEDGDDGITSGTAKTLSVGEVVGVDWRVGATLQSSTCSNLASPFVTVVLRIADSDGHVRAHPLELSVPEFSSFAATLREMSGALDRL